MRVPSPFRDQRSGLSLQLTPMIDCVFLLMIYFLWSSSFAMVEMTLPSTLTAQSPNSDAVDAGEVRPEADFESIVVRVQQVGGEVQWTVNDAPIGSLAEVKRILTSIANIKRNAPVVLDATGEVPLGDVIDVFDLSRLAGFERIQFAVQGPREGN
jgi:biopolymer transport protein ExbD